MPGVAGPVGVAGPYREWLAPLTCAVDDDIVVRVNPRARSEKRSRSSNRQLSWTDDGPPLTRSQIRQLQRQIRDLDDRARYLLASVFTKRLVLYYDVSQDTYAMNDPALGTLFKRRTAAEAIRRLLSRNVQILRCRVNRRNRLVKTSLSSFSLAVRRRHRRVLGRQDA